MVSNYAQIREENYKRYGTDIGRVGSMLLADRYDDRTHFIFELLQNAEDAIARRSGSRGSRSVNFHLTKGALRVSHYGQPFDEDDVSGICGIAESMKGLTAIGRFGIGFKSVYAITDRPEIHSGTEDFAIDNFVWPSAAPSMQRDPDETVIVLPLKPGDARATGDIERGLKRLGGTVLLFLRQITEINWRMDGGPWGLYLRESEKISPSVRRVGVIGQHDGQAETDETWLVFSRPVMLPAGHLAGHAEIAFWINSDDVGRERVQRVDRSPLVVFFPTVLETHLGFLVQGPYRTTPSRDNVPRNDPWNHHLVGETASLLVEALRWLRDHDLLDTTALRCLPLDPMKFDEASMFGPLFESTKNALGSEPLLPRFDTGHVVAARARLARTQELRELLTPAQLTALSGESPELLWLSGEITQDRTPELRRYLTEELGVAELTPETIVTKLNKPFLESQPDAWIQKLYEFFNIQQALRRRARDLPLIRLENGLHVVAYLNGQPQAFLPGEIKTGFPTVRSSVCAADPAREFLKSLGLTEPDPVDDVVRNVLPKYQSSESGIVDADYDTDIDRILKAFASDSKGQREKLVLALRGTAFVRTVDACDGRKQLSKPDEAYLATDRLKELFAGVKSVLLVDDSYPCLRGEQARELLEACGMTRYLQPVPVASTFTREQLREMRMNAGFENMSYELSIEDQVLRGLDRLLALLPQLDLELRSNKAALLWEALSELEDRRGTGVFSGMYNWHYYQHRSTRFDAAFVRKLNQTAWVPDTDGELRRPEFMLFDTLDWKANPFLQSKIRFKLPVIEQLAKEVGIEPGVIDLLKKHGITNVAELVARLGLGDEPKSSHVRHKPETVSEAIKSLLGDTPGPTPPVPDMTPEASVREDRDGLGGASTAAGRTPGRQSSGSPGNNEVAGRNKDAMSGSGHSSRESAGTREFITYVAVRPEEGQADPDGLDQAARIALETRAIELILAHESQWQRTPLQNPGFDLFETGEDGKTARWCEVKAMTGSLRNRPVGLSRTQFEFARDHGEAYWLYVVEHAGTDSATILCIQDPAGKARTFTFDHGWVALADTYKK
jgi:hypothetical protein